MDDPIFTIDELLKICDIPFKIKREGDPTKIILVEYIVAEEHNNELRQKIISYWNPDEKKFVFLKRLPKPLEERNLQGTWYTLLGKIFVNGVLSSQTKYLASPHEQFRYINDFEVTVDIVKNAIEEAHKARLAADAKKAEKQREKEARDAAFPLLR